MADKDLSPEKKSLKNIKMQNNHIITDSKSFISYLNLVTSYLPLMWSKQRKSQENKFWLKKKRDEMSVRNGVTH